MSIATERLLSLSCIEGMRLYRKHVAKHQKKSKSEIIALICELEGDAHTLDFEASIYLSDIVEPNCTLIGHGYYQACIKGIMLRHQPVWARLMRQGRTRFMKLLSPSDRDVFSAAGLLDEPAPIGVIKWWDEVSGFARLISDNEKLEQGRQAEILTLKYEQKRLKSIGIHKKVEWPGLDDNFAGYDVLSYQHGETGLVNLLIEVKSSTASPLRFIISRNEWDKAKLAGASYIFHIWNMRPDKPELHIRDVSDVAPHIPNDNGKGRWKNAEIPVRSGRNLSVSIVSEPI